MRKIAKNTAWFYYSRFEDANSYLILRKIDKHEDIKIAHISIFNIIINSKEYDFSHIPINFVNLKNSLIKKCDFVYDENKGIDDYYEGYELWEKENGGVWAIDVKEIIETTIATMLST